MKVELDVGDVLSRSFNVWTSNVLQFAAIAILFSIPFIMIQASPALFGAPPTVSLFGQFGNFLVGQLVTGFIALAVFQTLREGRPQIGESMSAAFSKFGALLLASIVVSIATGVGTLLCIVPGVIAALVFSVVVPSIVVERLGPMEGLSRSVSLTEGHRVQIFLIFLVIGLIYFAFIFGISCVGGAVVAGSSGATGSGFAEGFQAGQQASGGVTTGLFQVGGGIVGAVIMTFQSTLASVIYADLREIKEGTGVDQLIDVFQ